MGFILGLVVVFFFGSFLESQTFRRLFHTFEQLVIQIPFVKSIYTAIRDFSSLFSSEQKGKFKQVVLVKAAAGNSQQIGFITVSDFEQTSPAFIAEDQIAVFLPFSYQLGGYTVIMAKCWRQQSRQLLPTSYISSTLQRYVLKTCWQSIQNHFNVRTGFADIFTKVPTPSSGSRFTMKKA